MTRTTNKALKNLNASVSKSVKRFHPPEALTVSEWAEKYRRLSPENSAEAGPWRTARTPYLKEPMNAFTDPKVRKIVIVAASQVGKTEVILNIIGYIIDQDPSSIVFVHPSLDDARKFSRLRIAPMIRDSRPLREKVADVRTRDSGNTILQKTFPGGMLTLVGSNSASGLASTPARYIFGDERDRWAASAGTEGDPWGLAEARQASFYNAKSVQVSTPTIKGASNIETAFYQGTQERWCHQCPECGVWHNIVFDSIKFEFETKKYKNKKLHKVTSIGWACPSCGVLSTEETMRHQPTKWIAENPEAYADGLRSFWLNAFVSPWANVSWGKIAEKFLDAKDDPEQLKTVYNTQLGQLWEDRGGVEDGDMLLARRETYAAEVPNGAFILTCGVDTQDNRLEYEVVGHGHYGETWGIKKGVIIGKPNDATTWAQLDDVIERAYLHQSGNRLTISATFIDSGGHYTQEVYEACKARQVKKVFAIKGRGGDGIPYTSPPTQVPIRENKNVKCWLYSLGVDAGKSSIMSALKVQEDGAKYCHFPANEECGYDSAYFDSLLSEKLVLSHTKAGDKWTWQRLSGHPYNEALDCRNYAMAAFRVLNVDMEAYERRFNGQPLQAKPNTPQKQQKRHKRDVYDEW